MSSKAKSKVIGVSFNRGEPFLVTGDANNQSKVLLNNVIQIEEDGQPDLTLATQNKMNVLNAQDNQDKKPSNENLKNISQQVINSLSIKPEALKPKQDKNPNLMDLGGGSGFPNGLKDDISLGQGSKTPALENVPNPVSGDKLNNLNIKERG